MQQRTQSLKQSHTSTLLFLGAGLLILNYIRNKMPRGIRNNNAGNLENNGIKWNGLAQEQTDSRFYQFKTAEYGIRALTKTLRTYYYKYGLNTVEKIISRYAPSVENNTDSYINSVSQALKVEPTQLLYLDDVINDLVIAIIKHENGVQPYSVATIQDGITMAYTS